MQINSLEPTKSDIIYKQLLVAVPLFPHSYVNKSDMMCKQIVQKSWKSTKYPSQL